jgi:hypothetical protein
MTSLVRAGLLAFLVGCAACGDDGHTIADAMVDAIPDPCAPQMTFTGEYVDWDSTPATFLGVFGATFTHRADPTKTDTTNPNGRFDLCIPAADGFVDVTHMTGSAYVGGTVVVNRAVIQSGAMQSYRSFTATRAADFAFDSAKAHVFVHVAGTPRAVSLAAGHAPAQAFDGATWSAGATGSAVYFPNVDVQATTTLSVAGGALGTGPIPLTAGAFTYVTVLAN